MNANVESEARLGESALRWGSDPLLPEFGITDEVEPITGMVATIQVALPLLTGLPAGGYDPESGCAEGTILRIARDRAFVNWRTAKAATRE